MRLRYTLAALPLRVPCRGTLTRRVRRMSSDETRALLALSLSRRRSARTLRLLRDTHGSYAGAATRLLGASELREADRELTPLMLQPDRIGLIHADLHGANYVFHRGSPRPIDFGIAGFGPWLWDVAECVNHLGPRRRRDVIDAYAQRWPLDDGDIRRIEGYFIASLVEILGHHAPDPNEQEFLARAVPAWAPCFQRYVEGAPFLFDL